MNDFRALADTFYKDFFQRDLLGLILPGYLFWLAVWWHYPASFPPMATFPTSLHILVAVLSVGVAYISGFGIQALGVRLGLIRYYPFFETKEEFHARMSTFKTEHKDNLPQLSQRERYVALKQASGNSAALFLLVAFLFSFCWRTGHGAPFPVWILWSAGVVFWLAHLETLYNQRSFERAAISDRPSLKVAPPASKWDAVFAYPIWVLPFILKERRKSSIANLSPSSGASQSNPTGSPGAG